MGSLKDNVYYKKLRRWFKNRQKNDATRAIPPRRSPFYLRPIRLWSGKITVRHSDSPRYRTRLTGQRYKHAIKKNRRRSLHAQIPDLGPKSNDSVGRAAHATVYQDNQKIIVLTKNRLPWTRLSQQQSPSGREFTRLYSYVFKNTPLTRKLPFLGMMEPAVRKDGLSNLIIPLSVSNQKVGAHYPFWLVKNRIYELFQEPQLEGKPWSKVATRVVWDNSNPAVKYWEEFYNRKDPDDESKGWGVSTGRNYRTRKYTYLPHEFGRNTPIGFDTIDTIRLLTEAFSKDLLKDPAYKDQLALNEQEDIGEWRADPLPESPNVWGIKAPTGCECWSRTAVKLSGWQ